MIQYFQGLLQKLEIRSLKDYPKETLGYRLIIDFGWGNSWSGTPLSLTIIQTADSTMVESVELLYSDPRTMGFGHSVRKQLTYAVKDENFGVLDSTLHQYGFWTDYSFDKNDWGSIDGTFTFLELKSDSIYKLWIRELESHFGERLLLPFLNATHYNDTLAQGMGH